MSKSTPDSTARGWPYLTADHYVDVVGPYTVALANKLDTVDGQLAQVPGHRTAAEAAATAAAASATTAAAAAAAIPAIYATRVPFTISSSSSTKQAGSLVAEMAVPFPAGLFKSSGAGVPVVTVQRQDQFAQGKPGLDIRIYGVSATGVTLRIYATVTSSEYSTSNSAHLVAVGAA